MSKDGLMTPRTISTSSYYGLLLGRAMIINRGKNVYINGLNVNNNP